MSASLDSRSQGVWMMIRWGLALELVLAAAILAVAVFGIGPAMAQDPPSKGRAVDRVSIGSDGVIIERAGSRDTLETEGDGRRRPRRVQIGGEDFDGIHIDDGDDAIVRVFDDAHVEAGERVTGDVVAVFGSVTVDGQVDGDVVAVLGSVTLSPTAKIGGQAVAVGGTVRQPDGSVVEGESVSVSFLPMSWGLPGLSFGLSVVAAGWIAALFTGWLFAMLFPTRLVRVATIASRRTAASLMLGLISVPLILAVVALMFVTVVGIPLGLLLPPAYALLAFGGQLAATYVLGCKILRRPLGGGGGLMAPVFAGTVLVGVFFVAGAFLFLGPGIARPLGLFAVMLGSLILLGLTSIGTGAFLLSRLGALPADVEWNPAVAPAPGSPATGFSPPPTSA